jgi:hypothetical protein
MSLAEIKQEIIRLKPEERQEIAALMHELTQRDNPNYLRELEAEIERMERGEKFSSAQVYALHERLKAEGR